jgi:hypothetical protein
LTYWHYSQDEIVAIAPPQKPEPKEKPSTVWDKWLADNIAEIYNTD